MGKLDDNGFDLLMAAINADPEAVMAYTAWLLASDPAVLPIENETVRKFLTADGVELKCAPPSSSSPS